MKRQAVTDPGTINGTPKGLWIRRRITSDFTHPNVPRIWFEGLREIRGIARAASSISRLSSKQKCGAGEMRKAEVVFARSLRVFVSLFFVISIFFPVCAHAAGLNKEMVRLSTREEIPCLELNFEKEGMREIRAVFLNPESRVVIERRTRESARKVRIEIPELAELNENSREELILWRLVLSIRELWPGGNHEREVFGVGNISMDAAGVRVSMFPGENSGARYLQLESYRLSDGEALGDIEIRILLQDGEDNPIGELTTRTDQYGLAEELLPVDQLPPGDEGLVTAVARSGAFSVPSRIDFWVDAEKTLVFACDRKLYQPGETVRFRVVVMVPNQGPVEGAGIRWTITDPENVEVFSSPGLTSSMGVAHQEWTIPPEIRPGDYILHVKVDQTKLQDRHYFTIMPFERPGFRVRVRNDTPYVLPGEKAEVNVDVTTFDGAPLRGALVEIDKRPPYMGPWGEVEDSGDPDILTEGLTGADGRVHLKIDPWADEHTGKDTWKYRQFRDLKLIVRARDPLSGRRVRTPFDLRLSGKPVHVYLMADENNYMGLPIIASAGSYRADGEPLACSITLMHLDRDGNVVEELGHLETDKFGLGYGLLPSPGPESSGFFHLRLEAECSGGLKGSSYSWASISPDTGFRIRPERSIFFPGENIRLVVENSGDAYTSVLRAEVGGHPLFHRIVDVPCGKSILEIPWDTSFQGRIGFFLMPPIEQGAKTSIADTLVFIAGGPGRKPAELEIRALPENSRPGDTVTLEFSFQTDGEIPPAAVAGIDVIDEALESLLQETEGERAFSAFRKSSCRNLREKPSVSGLTLEDLSGLLRDDASRRRWESTARRLLQLEDFWIDSKGPEVQRNLRRAYSEELDRVIQPVAALLEPCTRAIPRAEAGRWYDVSWRPGKHRDDTGSNCPVSIEEFFRMLDGAGINPSQLIDPWSHPLEIDMKTRKRLSILSIVSRGPDGLADTDDDLPVTSFQWPWFRRGTDIRKAVMAAFHQKGIWPKSHAELLEICQQAGIETGDLHDPRGRPLKLRLELDGTDLNIRVEVGVDEKKLRARLRAEHDHLVWMTSIDTFESTARILEEALVRRLTEKRPLPQNDTEARELAVEAGIPPESLRDLQGRDLYFKPESSHQWSDIRREGNEGSETTVENVYFLGVFSPGKDSLAGTSDDVPAARIGNSLLRLARKLKEMDDRLITENVLSELLQSTPGQGALAVDIIDGEGFALPGVSCRITREKNTVLDVISDADGRVVLGLEPGVYDMECLLSGFKSEERKGILVQAREVTETAIVLQVEEEWTEGVYVTAEAPVVETSAISSSPEFIPFYHPLLRKREMPRTPTKDRPGYTPRVRRDFPATLLWEPELVLDPSGTTRLDMPLGDGVTTWRVQAVATTRDGRVLTTEKEVVSTLPFVLDSPFPARLTVGDRVFLPLILRNHTRETVDLDVLISSDSDSIVIKDQGRKVEVPPLSAEKAVFKIKVRDGEDAANIRAEARGQAFGDAIEKKVDIAADAHQWKEVRSCRLRDSAVFQPIAGTRDAEPVRKLIRVLPSVKDQLRAVLNGMIRRPGACAEQLSSVGMAHILMASILDESSDESGAIDERDAARAILVALRSRQTSDGAMSYWPEGAPNLALTAHVLEFIADCDDDLIPLPEWPRQSALWLAGRVGNDGLPIPVESEESSRKLALAASVTLALARSSTIFEDIRPAAESALDAVALRLEKLDEPHALATLVLSANIFGKKETAEKGIRRLLALEQREGSESFWALRRNTPLSGWGLPGRMETTALVIRALQTSESSECRDASGRGLRFLLRHKGPFGAWYSTSTSIQVMKALIGDHLAGGTTGGQIDLVQDGVVLASVKLPAHGEPSGIIEIPLPGINPAGEIEILRSGGDSRIEVDLETLWSEDWSALPDGKENLAMEVSYSRIRLKRGEEIVARVQAGRVHHRGYGMLLAEIGLPPGADVDRTRLQSRLPNSRFEILPDRVVLYLNPEPGGTEIEIPFTVEISGDFLTAPSSLADYYNPLNRLDLAPVRIRVKDR